MSYSAKNYSKLGQPLSDVIAAFDRAWVLNGYEQCSFGLSIKKVLKDLEDYEQGNHLVIDDDVLDIWGGFYDTPMTEAGTGDISKHAYSGERLFAQRPAADDEREIPGTPGAIFGKGLDMFHALVPYPTLLQPGDIWQDGKPTKEKVGVKSFYEDIQRIATDNGHDFWVTPVLQNGVLHYEANWAKQRGERKDIALEEGVNIERSNNLVETQGDIWNYVIAIGDGATDADKIRAVAFDEISIGRYDVRVTTISVSSNSKATIQNAADEFLADHAYPSRTFNLTVGGERVADNTKEKTLSILRIGDTVDLRLYSVGNDGGKRGVETEVRIIGMTHRGIKGVMDLLVTEVLE